MDKKTFNKITKEVFGEYGFVKSKDKYVLELKDVTIVVKFASWRGVKSFNYYFSINELRDPTVPAEKVSDTLVEIKMEHSSFLEGYHRHEILYEVYEEQEFKDILNRMLHSCFDPYKKSALQYLRENDYRMTLSKNAREYLGVLK